MKNQQNQDQQEFNIILSKRLSSNKVKITEVITAELFSEIKRKIQIFFGKVPHSNFGIPPQYFLELYQKLYTQEETEFSIIEVGIISDLYQIYYREDNLENIEEMLLLKQEAQSLSEKYHNIRKKCEGETIRELKAKIVM